MTQKKPLAPCRRILLYWLVSVFIGSVACSDGSEGQIRVADDAGGAGDLMPRLEMGSEVDTAGDEVTEVADAVSQPLSWPVEALGPFRVGYRSWNVIYTPLEEGSAREILMNIWYPTTDQSGPGAAYLGIIRDDQSLLDAQLAPSVYGAQFPLLAHSHGFQSFGGGSAFLMRWFASHGWVVIAPDHTGNTFSDHRDPLPSSHFIARPRDIGALLDALDSLPADDPLSGVVDTGRVVLSGHSFGAYTTWSAAGAAFDMDRIREACQGGGGALPAADCSQVERDQFALGLREPRIVATIPMAGTFRRSLFGEAGEADVVLPVLYLSGSEDNQSASQEQFDTLYGPDLTWVELEGGCHETFGIEACEHLDVGVSTPVVGAYALAFARHHLLGDVGDRTIGILSGDVELSPVATVRH